MLIVVSGTHASGKSTLISDFALHHPEAAVGGDVFDLVAQDDDHASARMFATQLRVAADRILATPAGELTILERGPLTSWPISSLSNRGDVMGSGTVLELSGTPEMRAMALESAMAHLAR
ncbi:hypothetical protein [Microbacterium gorillae]|uniref:hypothetical protein n=1 Tax=Microbacterium gorillae TaxID=1231063 RepID=UPI003D9847EF